MANSIILDLAAGREQSLALMSNGEVWGWGAEGSGRVILPNVCSIAPPAEPIIVPSPRPFQRIFAGYGVSYALTAEQRAYVWGIGRGGLGGQQNQTLTLQARPLGQLDQVVEIAAGEFHGIARKADGTLHGWGLPRGTMTGLHNAPIQPLSFAPHALQVSASPGHVLVWTDAGLYAWGANGAGQLGLGHLTDQAAPQPVAAPEPDWQLRQLAAGTTHTLALDQQGRVWAWGSNQHGQLGHRRAAYLARPERVPLAEPISAVAAGMFFSVALAASGRVYTWGWHGKGQLGRPAEANDATPTPVPELNAIHHIAAGQGHVLASGGRTLYAWGDNAASQLGPQGPQATGPTQPGRSAEPVLVLG